MSYLAVRQLHVALVAATLTLFCVRCAWMLASPERLQTRWAKVVPHVIDTVLLLSGVWLAWQLGSAGIAGWLPAKLAALVVYVVLGTIALKRGRTRRVRIAAALAALLVAAYMISVAIHKSPWPF